MEFTIKLKNDRYLDLVLFPSKRILVINSPIPDLDKSDLEDLVAAFGYKIALSLTSEMYSFKIQKDKEVEFYKTLNEAYTFNTKDALAAILGTANIIIAGSEEYEI